MYLRHLRVAEEVDNLEKASTHIKRRNRRMIKRRQRRWRRRRRKRMRRKERSRRSEGEEKKRRWKKVNKKEKSKRRKSGRQLRVKGPREGQPTVGSLSKIIAILQKICGPTFTHSEGSRWEMQASVFTRS